MTAPAPLLCLEHLLTYAAWVAHGPATVHQLAGRSDRPVIELQPRTLELVAIGAVAIVGQSGSGPVYAAALTEAINAPSGADVVERTLTTLPVRDQVSIAAGIMARHGRRGARAHTPAATAPLELTGTAAEIAPEPTPAKPRTFKLEAL